jgi:hypothetical protein
MSDGFLKAPPRAARRLPCRARQVLLAAAGATLLAACSPDFPLPAELIPQPAPGACETLTYDNFGAAFFYRYCLLCHHEDNVGDRARFDAPTGINFNRLSGIRQFLARIRLRAGIQGDMPPRLLPVPQPTEAERVQLIEWLDCGAPTAAELP